MFRDAIPRNAAPKADDRGVVTKSENPGLRYQRGKQKLRPGLSALVRGPCIISMSRDSMYEDEAAITITSGSAFDQTIEHTCWYSQGMQDGDGGDSLDYGIRRLVKYFDAAFRLDRFNILGPLPAITE